jgi:hypothetical protein
VEVAAVGAALAAPAVGKEQVMAVLVIFDDLRRDGIVGALAKEADVWEELALASFCTSIIFPASGK